MAINVRGTAFAMQRALKEMLPRGTGSIINMSSINALVGLGGGAAYAASKGAILSLSRQVACEVADRGVRVNALAPGAIATNLFDNTAAILGDANPSGPLAEAFKTRMMGSVPKIPLGGAGEPIEVAHAAGVSGVGSRQLYRGPGVHHRWWRHCLRVIRSGLRHAESMRAVRSLICSPIGVSRVT